MTLECLLTDFGEADPLDHGLGVGEILFHEGRVQPDGIEDLGAAVGLIGGDAHLRHHLENAFVQGIDVVAVDFFFAHRFGQSVTERR